MLDMTGNPAENASGLTVARDVPCRRCGYNLRGLSPAGRCPECAAPVIVALQPDVLTFADPQWLAKLVHGHRLFTRGSWSYLLLGLAIRPLKDRLPHSAYLALAGAALAILIFINFRGIWLMLSPPPAELGKRKKWSDARFLARAALIISASAVAVSPGLWRLWGWHGVFPVQFVFGPAGIGGLIGFFAMARYVESLSVRSTFLRGQRPNFITQRARLYRRGYLVSWLLCVPGALADFYAPARYAIFLWGFGAVGMLAFGILLVYLPLYLTDVIRLQHEYSTQVWQQAEAEGHIDLDAR